MPTQAQYSTCVFRTIILVGLTAVLIPAAVLPMPAQNAVPSTEAQAARVPHFASRLHPTSRPASRPNPAVARRGFPQEGIIYDNGPIDGRSNGWEINSGFVVSDSINIEHADVTTMTFGAWLFAGDTLGSVEVSITSEPNGGTSYFDQTVSFTQSGCFLNDGFNVCTETSSNLNTPTLQPGTYWVNLQNAFVNSGDPVYWDQNNGPSEAYESSVGTIPSESFTMFGDTGPPTCFQSSGRLQIIHDFSQQEGAPDGVTIDRAGNLYGTSENGGSDGAGFAYKLGRFAGWLLDPLFNFSGGNTGGQPSGVIVAPNGTLYGGAQGGIQSCGTDGSQYCGLVFNLRPRPTTCATSQCSWNENVPYRFSSESDGSGTINASASDQHGNLYGTTTTGGTYDQGTVFELTPTGGGWTKTTLYSFTGGGDGATPTQVLVGNDGNLYGAASGVGQQSGFVFQLTPSGGDHWTESVLHTFSGNEGGDPGYLVQDSTGNLYGIVSLPSVAGLMFGLQKSSGWAFSEYVPQHRCQPGDLPYNNLYNLAIDAAGNLYGTGAGGERFAGNFGKRSPGGGTCFYNYIFKASYDSSGWHYQDLDFFPDTYFPASGSLALDSSGNLYGTTSGCGTNNAGTVWQLSP